MSETENLVEHLLSRCFLPMEASGRHVHLTEQDIHALFAHPLTEKRALSQPGQYLCEERVSLIGPKGKLEQVAVLGPARGDSQVEISLTDARLLGLCAPVRLSGSIQGTPGITLMGPAGSVTLRQGVIIAQRHIHMTPEDGEFFHVKDGQSVQVRCFTERPVILQDVPIRVSRNFSTVLHMDYDEANACGFRPGDKGLIQNG